MSWAPIDDGRYQVSRDGRVRSVRAGKELKPNFSPSTGYYSVQIGGRRRVAIHRLVAQAFLGPRPDGHHVNHKNGVKADNRIENLEYCTPSENMKHAHRIGLQSNRGERHPRHRMKESDVRRIFELLALRVPQPVIAREFGIDRSMVCRINKGKNWSHVCRGA